jgi:hypothetical protein
MSACYIKLNNFQLARVVLNDALKLSDRVSQIYLRKAQIVLCNRCSSIEELEKGYAEIKKAREMQPYEKIYQTTNYNILKMCNIHDVKEVYEDVEKQLKVRIEE